MNTNNNNNINDVAAEALNILSPQAAKKSSKSTTIDHIDWLTNLAEFAPLKQELCGLLWALICRYKDGPSGELANEIMEAADAELTEEIATIIFGCENIASGTDVGALYDAIHDLNGTVEMIVGGEKAKGVQRIFIELEGPFRKVEATFDGETWGVTSK